MARVTTTSDNKATHRELLQRWVLLVRDNARRLDERAHLEMSRLWIRHHRGQP
jgi:hypothetical protein